MFNTPTNIRYISLKRDPDSVETPTCSYKSSHNLFTPTLLLSCPLSSVPPTPSHPAFALFCCPFHLSHPGGEECTGQMPLMFLLSCSFLFSFPTTYFPPIMARFAISLHSDFSAYSKSPGVKSVECYESHEGKRDEGKERVWGETGRIILYAHSTVNQTFEGTKSAVSIKLV